MARVALVTGGMGGLGEAVCIKLAALGYRVVTTHSPGNTKAGDWLQTMNNMGYGFKAFACDVADFDSCKACVEKVTAEVGAVDVLVNNAGITRDMTFKKMTKADWDAVVSTNLDSVFNMTKQVMDGMVERKWGGLSTSLRSMARRAPSDRRTTPLPRPACMASPRRWRSRSRETASPSIPFLRDTSAPRW